MPADRARARNRLRNIYDQEKRRQGRLAESRGKNRGNRSNRGANAQNTRVVVSERRTRREGFGRGGVQVTGRRGSRRNENNNNRGGRTKRRFADRFADKSIVRSGASSRFEKGDRNRNKNSNRRVTRGRDGRKKVVQQKNKQGGRRFRERKNEQKKKNGNGKRGNNNNNSRNNKKELSAADLDAQLTAYQTGQSVSQVKKNQTKSKVPTQADLDAQLDAFQAATNNAEGGITL